MPPCKVTVAGKGAGFKGQDAKGFEKCWRGGADGESVTGFWQVNKLDREESSAGEKEDGAGLTHISATAAVHVEGDRATLFSSRCVAYVTVGAEPQ